MNTNAVITFENVTLGYDRHPAVHHLNGEVREGTLTAIVGPNGAGKSTLLKGVVGALRPLDGTIRLSGVQARDIAYLPQQSSVDRSFPMSVFDLVSMGLWREIGLFGGLGRARKLQVRDALSAVGLEGFERRSIGTLSGGQLQRTLFARLLLQDAQVIALDEPFNALDAKTAADLMALVQRWHGESRTIVAVLHDLNLVRDHFPDTLLIARRTVGWGRTEQVLTGENLLRARQIYEAFDDHAPVCEHAHAA
ncbi:MAG: metal ABC transporter ATP-binding protein [Chromatiales bacterium]|jgi:zinc/manganese transport system ATP-binding protein|nr:metal ABC transporter ATP-binding protein [Chromatiales bacterium]